MAVLPLIMTQTGLQPQAPADIRQAIIDSVAIDDPGYTANLPGSLIEDICSTDVAACVQSDSFLVDLVNSIAPNGANAFLLAQLGQLYGLEPQQATNTSVYVIFTGNPGFVIVQGFTVSDGTYSYIIQDGGVIGTNGQSLPLYAIATQQGTWAVPAGAVTELQTSVPIDFTLSCVNPEDGIPSTATETITQYHDRVMTAGLASSAGMARYLKTLLANIPGVIARLVGVVQNPVTDISVGSWTVICGGGDPYQVAYAIYYSDFYIPGLSGSIIRINNISNSMPAIVTTTNNHNLATGDIETMFEVIGIPGINGIPLEITVTGPQSFTVPYDTTSAGNYQYGGIVTPNPINEIPTIVDYPDSYIIPYVIPPQETTQITLEWLTDSPNYVSQSAMAQSAGPAIMDYVNNLPVGTTPLNLNTMTQIFLTSVQNILPPEAIVGIYWTIYINGNNVNPAPGTQSIFGDPYSYFYTDLTLITISEVGQ